MVLIGAGSNPADVILPFASFLASVLLKLIAERISYYVHVVSMRCTRELLRSYY